MDYSNVDLKDLIDTSNVHDLVPMYPRPTPTSSFLKEDFSPMDDELIEVHPLISMVSALPTSSSDRCL